MFFLGLGLDWATLGRKEALVPGPGPGRVGETEPDTDLSSPSYWVAEGTVGGALKDA